MEVLKLNGYINKVNKIVEEKMCVIPYNDPDSTTVRYKFQPLNWTIEINKMEFDELYALCASVDYAYYHIRRLIVEEFSLILFNPRYKNQQ